MKTDKSRKLYKANFANYAFIPFFVLFFILVQILSDKSQFFWLSLFAPVIEGKAIVEENSSRSDFKFKYYTIRIKGVGAAPDFLVHNQWTIEHYSLRNIHAIIELSNDISTETDRPTEHFVVDIEWTKPWFSDEYYVSIQGDDDIFHTDIISETIWLVLSIFPLLLISIFLRYRLTSSEFGKH